MYRKAIGCVCERELSDFYYAKKQILISFRRIYLWVKVQIEVCTIMCDAQAHKAMFVFVRYGVPLGSVLG